MLVNLKKMVAYICPVCSNISSKYVSVFNFSGRDKLNLICPTHGCHENCVTINKKNDKYKIIVECPLCGGTHNYAISQDGFWHKKLMTYKCPAAGIDIFFIGDRYEVEKTLDESSDIYSDIIDEFEFEEDAAFSILFSIIEQLHKLRDTNDIECMCGSSNIDINVVNGNIILSCNKCGKTKVIEATEDTLMRLLNSNKVVIGN